MPSKKNQENQEDQSERFKKTVADLEAAGELNPTEANAAFEALMHHVAPRKAESNG